MEKVQKLDGAFKHRYEHPQIELIKFDYTDIISTSVCGVDCDHAACTGDTSF